MTVAQTQEQTPPYVRERDMTLGPKIRATSSQTNNEKTHETGQESRMHICTSTKNDYLTEIIPGFTLLSNGSQQNPWTKYGRNCSDDSFLETLSVLRSHQSSRFSSI